jgi:hypothetical protein
MCTRQYLSQHDLAVLHRFAREHGIDESCSGARKLVSLLATSLPLPETDADPCRVGLGATVHYRPDGVREISSIVIACPYDMQAMLARVTILSPLALGLLGHAEGCTVVIDLLHARSMTVDIVAVEAAAFPVCHPRSRPFERGF